MTEKFYTPPPDMDTFTTVFLDVDGVLWHEGRPVPGANETLTELRRLGKGILFLTNRSTGSRRSTSGRLAEAGLDVRDGELLNSPYAASLYISGQLGPSKVYAIGSPGLFEELEGQGHTLTDQAPDFVVVGFKPLNHLSKEMINTAAQAVKQGAQLIACNKDKGNFMPDGTVNLGSFFTVGAIERAAGAEAHVIGKPHKPMYELGLTHCNATPEECLMVGDVLETDIIGGQLAGLKTVLVMTGYTTVDMVTSSDIVPDHILPSIADLCGARPGAD